MTSRLILDRSKPAQMTKVCYIFGLFARELTCKGKLPTRKDPPDREVFSGLC
jgi:hypothetical protein